MRRAVWSLDLDDFSSLRSSGAWIIDLTRGSAWQIDVEAAQDRRERLDLYVRDGVLHLEDKGSNTSMSSLSASGNRVFVNGSARIEVSGSVTGGLVSVIADESNVQWHSPVRLRVTMPTLEELDLSDHTTVRFSGFDGDQLTINARGLSNVRGDGGRFSRLSLAASGSSTIDLSGLPITDVAVDLSGRSRLSIAMAGGELSGRIAGSGEIEYSGTITRQALSTSGIVQIRQAD